MPRAALLIGVLLILLGLVGYFGDDSQAMKSSAETVEEVGDKAVDNKGPSVTALIPAAVGGLIALCGLIGLKESLRKHAMHAAVMIGLLGLLAGVGRGGMSLGKMMSGAEVNSRSLVFVWLMAILCGIFVVMCVQSFRNARKMRQAGESDLSKTADVSDA